MLRFVHDSVLQLVKGFCAINNHLLILVLKCFVSFNRYLVVQDNLALKVVQHLPLTRKKDSLDNKRKLAPSTYTDIYTRVCMRASVSLYLRVCLCVSTHVLTVCANEREAGDYAFLSQGTGAFSQELQCIS